MRVAAVLLAAGRSTRFGERLKQLVEWHGETLVHRMARQLLDSRADRVAVVVGRRGEEVAAAVADLDLQVIDNPRFADGQSTSLRAGVEAVEAMYPHADALLFVPCDQPRLSIDTIDRVIAAGRADPDSLIDVRYPTHRGCPGHRGPPTFFSRNYYPELRRLRGDTGGREILRRHAHRVRSIEVRDPLEGADIDTPADLERLLAADR